eukprot:m.250710 g.250710  ORF g.250710 m.250710 type:complete len:73 (-) comp19101_c0_seq2:118-336(-)
MELPHLGRQCAKQGCGQLDFLPYKCNACSATFCQDHYSYTAHECPEAYRKVVTNNHNHNQPSDEHFMAACVW